MGWEDVAALGSLGIGGLLLFALAGWWKQGRRDLPSSYLLLLLVLSVVQALKFLYNQGELFERWPHLLKVADPLLILLPFGLFAYIRALQGDSVLARGRGRWWHAVPALLLLGLNLPFWLLSAQEKLSWIHLAEVDESLWPGWAPYGSGYNLALAALGLFYWWRQQALGTQGVKAALQEWLGRLQWLQLSVALLLMLSVLLKPLGARLPPVYLQLALSAYFLFLVLMRSRLPATEAQGGAPSRQPAQSEPPSAAGAPADPVLQALFQDLERSLAGGLFRDPELSLGKLAGRCGMTTHQASQAINGCSGGNFYGWVNRYRVEEAMRLLRGSEASVSDICYQVGFNSKSTFNTAFRRHAGCTPSAFRQQG